MKTFLTLSLVVLGFTLLALREVRLNRQWAAARTERQAMQAQVTALQEQLQALPEEIRARLDQASNALDVAESRLNQVTARAAELERRLQTVQAQTTGFRSAPAPSGTRPDFDPQATAPGEFAAVFPKRNRWGPEELTGPPDTAGAGDIVTAWAAARPDSGTEWLKLDYDSAVDIREVRIRETYNPGAVAKVTALQPNGDELVLWEGQSEAAQAPNDFVVPVSQPCAASQIKVYLDSQRVQGWNEIDAVELVGKDGSRQWARNASASSTYAEPQRSRRWNETEWDSFLR